LELFERNIVRGFEFKDTIKVPTKERLIRPCRLVEFSSDFLGLGWAANEPLQFLAEDASSDPVASGAVIAEFYSRQLQEVDSRDDSAVLAFSNTYGLALSPFYDSTKHLITSREKNAALRKRTEPFDRDDKANIAICEAASLEAERFLPTDSQAPRVFFTTQQTLAAQFYIRQVKAIADASGKSFTPGGIVALKEVSDTIRLLQNATLLTSTVDALDESFPIIDYLLSQQHRIQRGATYFLDDFEKLYETETNRAYWIGESAQRAYDFLCFARTWRDVQPEDTLTALTVSQFLDVFNDAMAWHVCENTSCGRIFKFHEGTNGKARASRFCRVNCNKIQARREQLAGEKAARREKP
jgi:hypothetical protein